MAARKPLVLVDGKPQQLPDDDVVAGFPLFVPIGLAAGGVLAVPLTVKAALSVGLAEGGAVQVPVGV